MNDTTTRRTPADRAAMYPDSFGHRGQSDLETKVFQALGTASVCWEPMDGTGVFDDKLAKKTGDELVAWIRANHRAPIDRDELKAVVMSLGPDPAPAEVADAVVAHMTAVEV